ncbi:MAG TPA: SDR family oxidoreductase [Mucilaginibacter sp.]|jgi:NAD(P)-dependent dehydrogenase (short-subunit alcohol dehydrogenase family)|nr:SDR family oxidoreductase [Mucilaginibacter sp.]
MKTALVTGANKGIGFEVVKQLIDKGYYVYLGSRDLQKGQEAVKQLQSDNVEIIQIDVNDKESIEAAHEQLSKKISSLDVLINNAGILGGMQQGATTTDISIFREVFETNLFGVVLVTQTFLDLLKKSDAPRIVNVTSGLGSLTLHNDPNWKYYKVKSAVYGPSKSALNGYTIVLAYELRDTNFKVNAVDPGYTATDFNHHSGPGTIKDAAARIVKYAIIDENGPTGGFFSDDNNLETGVSPW